MDQVRDIVNKRITPGVLIVDAGNKILHSNHEALSIIPGIGKNGSGAKPERLRLPSEITVLCDEVKAKAAPASSIVTPAGEASPYALRAFYIEEPDGESGSLAIMVLMEKVVTRHEVDFTEVRRQYALSRREIQVLEKVSRGLTNREIAEAMFISECTVKGHIKKIMKRMNVKSRSEMIAALR